jgi:hypothetical protein
MTRPGIFFLRGAMLAIAAAVLFGLAFAEASVESAGLRQKAHQADAASGQSVQVEVMLIELGRGTSLEIEKGAGVRLDPTSDQAILTGDRKDRLLAAVNVSKGARTVASSAASVHEGNEALLQLHGQLLHSVHSRVRDRGSSREEPSKEPTPASNTGEPVKPEGKNVLAAVKLKPTLTDGRIALVATVHVSIQVATSKRDDEDSSQPVFSTWMKTTSAVLRGGSSLLIKEPLLMAVLASRVAENAAVPAEEPTAAKRNNEPLETEIFRFEPDSVETETIVSPAGALPVEQPGVSPWDEPASGVAATVKSSLLGSGLPWPEGSNVVYNSKTSALIIANTSANMRVVRQLMEKDILPFCFQPQERESLLILISVKPAGIAAE